MIVTCPACMARFAVPDALIPPEGRTVKCGRCAHQWHVDSPVPMEDDAVSQFASPDFAAEVAAAQEALAAQEFPVMPRQLPVRQPKPLPRLPFMVGAGLLAAMWLVVAGMVHYPGWLNVPVLRGVYGMFGVHRTDGLVFEDVGMQRSTVDGKTQFLISGSITNRAAEARLVPSVRVQLNNATGKTVWSREYPVNERLEPGKPYAFRIDNVTTSFGASVATIVLDIGHPLQLMMR